MKTRYFALVLGLSAAALVGCTVESTGGTGGSGQGGGGQGGSGDGGAGVGGGATGTGGTDATGGGGGDNGFAACLEDQLNDGATCAGCGPIVTSEACGIEHACPNSKALVEALSACTCGDGTNPGKCNDACPESCGGSGTSTGTECADCVTANCTQEYNDCANDIDDT